MENFKLLVLPHNKIICDMENSKVCNVETVIIGGGVAGLAAASRLLERGYTDFVLLEAQSRLGGRVYTRPFDGGKVEVGAEWIHGEEGNVVYDIAQALKQDNYEDGESDDDEAEFVNSEFFNSDGRRIPQRLLRKTLRHIDFLVYEKVNEMKKFTGSVAQFLTLEFDKYLNNNNGMEPLQRSLLDWYMKFQCSIDGCDSLMDIRTKSYDTYQECEGSQAVRWNDGYETLVQYLVKDLPEEKIRTKCEVTSISWSDGVNISCQTGEQYQVKRAIITFSLGVLKALPQSFFSPPLPKEKKEVISCLQMGTVNKIYLKFPHRWWSEDSDGFCFTWSENEDSYHPDIQNLKNSWLRDIFCFSDAFGHSSVMCGWVSGESARVMEELTEEQVKEDCMKLLRGFLGHSYDIPQPKHLFRSSWYWNPFFRGSYSYHSEASDDMDLWHSDLAKPLKDADGNEVLLFAGEATHAKYFSTVHGALETGWREADRILRRIKRKDEAKIT